MKVVAPRAADARGAEYGRRVVLLCVLAAVIALAAMSEVRLVLAMILFFAAGACYGWLARKAER